jgi:hypothetical protein
MAPGRYRTGIVQAFVDLGEKEVYIILREECNKIQ